MDLIVVAIVYRNPSFTICIHLEHLIRNSGWLVKLAVQVKVEYTLKSFRVTVEKVVTIMRVEIRVQVRGTEQRLRIPGQNLSILDLMQIVCTNKYKLQSIETRVQRKE